MNLTQNCAEILCEHEGQESACPSGTVGVRYVRFAESIEIRSSASSDHDVDPPSLWYNQEDYNKFKAALVAEAKHVVRKWRKCKSKSNVVRSLREAYSTIADSSTGGFNAVYLYEVDISFHDTVEVIGLEKLIAMDCYWDKRRRRELTLDVLEEVQSGFSKHCQDELRAAVLRYSCEIISRPSKLFAEYLGLVAASSQNSSTV